MGVSFVEKILEERLEAFLFAAAEIRDGVRLEAGGLTREDGINEAREHGARNPKTAIGHERKGALKLLSRLDVGKQALDAQAQQGIAVPVVVLFAGHDQTAGR